jgi:DNA polymerase elongation subunit (family B)
MDSFNETRMSAIQKRMKILGIKGLLGRDELKENKLKL